MNNSSQILISLIRYAAEEQRDATSDTSFLSSPLPFPMTTASPLETGVGGNGSQGDNSSMWFPKYAGYNVTLKIQMYMEPFIIAIGIIGNIVAVLTLLSVRLRATSCCLYLAAKCIGDTLFLAGLTVNWFYRIHIPLITITGICQLTQLFTNACSFTTVWLIVLVSHENFIRIARPQHVKLYCTIRRATINIVIVYIASLVLNNFYIWTTRVIQGEDNGQTWKECSALEQFKDLLVFVNVMDTLTTVVVPTLLLSFLLAVTAVAVVHALQRRNRLNERLITQTRQHVRLKPGEVKVAKFLLAVTLSLFVLQSPQAMLRLRLYFLHLDKSWKGPTENEMILKGSFELLYYFNFSANLFIYLLSGDNFRKEFITLFGFATKSVSENINNSNEQTTNGDVNEQTEDDSLKSDSAANMELTPFQTSFTALDNEK